MKREWLKTPEVRDVPISISKTVATTARLAITEARHIYVDVEEFEFRGKRHRASMHFYLQEDGKTWAPRDRESFWCRRGFHDEVPKSHADIIREALVTAIHIWANNPDGTMRPEVLELLREAELAHNNNELSRVEDELKKARAALAALEARAAGFTANMNCAKEWRP